MKHDKLRDMVRSILPSRYRYGPRDAKLHRKRAHRHAIRGELRRADFEETGADLLRDVRLADIVRWRRDGDKLAHFMRWCEAITEGMTEQEALAFVRGILPKNLIGDHAYGHWESHRKWMNRRRTFVKYAEEMRRGTQSYRDSATFRLRRALHEDPTLHRRLNAAIKAAKQPGEPRRMLYGEHDVEAFVVDIDREQHRAERRILFELIEQIEKEVEKGGHRAALRVVNHFLLAA